MATTVEDILVRFSGDASGLVNASEKAKVKTFSLGEQLLKLDKQMAKVFASATPDMAKAEELFRKMENSAKKLAMRLEEIRNQEGKAGGGTKAFGMFTLAGAASAVTSRIINAIEPMVKEVALNIGSALEQGITGSGTSLSSARRTQEREDDRGGYLESIRDRGIGDRGAAVDRAIRSPGMKNALTGERNSDRELETRKKQQTDIQKQMAESQKTIRNFEKEMEDNDSILSKEKEKRFADAKKGLEEETKYYRKLEQAAHDAGEKIKDLESEGSMGSRMKDRLTIENHSLETQKKGIGLSGEQLTIVKERERLAWIIANAGKNEVKEAQDLNALLEERERILADIKADTEANDALEAAQKKARDESIAMSDRLLKEKYAKAGRGFSGVEAEVLSRHAEGKEEGNAELLKNAYEKEADAINKKFLPATVKAQIEIERLNMLREKGLLNSEAYDKAILEQVKVMDPGGRAGSRAATVTGSAEHFSRMDEYQRTMDQPKADSAAVDRAMKEAKDNPVVKTIQEGNKTLRLIVEGQKKFIPFKPANVE